MNKKTIVTDIGKELELSAESTSQQTPIDTLISWLEARKGEGATHLDFTARCDYDGCSESVDIQAQALREETDEELQIRIEKQKQDEKRQTEYEIASLRARIAQLSKKVEG